MERSKAERDQLFEEWLAENNRHIGEVSIPQIGEYPVNLKNFYGSVVNEYITTDLIRHYADAHGDRNPLWRDESYARKTRWGSIIAPPTFADSLIQAYPYKFEPDKFEVFGGLFQMPTGSRRENFKPFRHGDKIHVVHKYLGMKELDTDLPAPTREFDEAVERWIYNQNDELLSIVTTHNRCMYDMPFKPGLSWDSEAKKRRITDEQREEIFKGYANETRRGAETLYWEDVEVGSEYHLHPLGPYNEYDVIAFYTAMAGHAVAFELEWERVKEYPEFGWIDPESNGYTANGVCHVCDHKGHADIFSNGNAMGFFMQMEGLLGRMICNWMGDDSFVTVMDTRSNYLPVLSEIICCHGKVTGKRQENGKNLVDLYITATSLEGRIWTEGTATVELVSRK